MPDSEFLKQQLTVLSAGTEEEREAAAERLMAAGGPAVPGLQAVLAADAADARWWAARTLAGIPGAAAAEVLGSALSDPDEDVRVCAVMGLGERREAAAVDGLLMLLLSANGYVGRHIGDALSKIGEPAVPGLIRALQDERPVVRVQAARALVRIESQQAIPALIEALDDPEPAVEHYAWEALQRMGVGAMCYFEP
ncbi:MAG: HEAT repeat domain-containing protein [Anaerolineales bacterium]|nr:HEAT repeat domain-containing protein [Anaerolineales bacterium]